MVSVIGDIRDFELLKKTFFEASPEVVFHLAAQPIVRDSYKHPRYTYETNVMGTVNLLECVRLSKEFAAFSMSQQTKSIKITNGFGDIGKTNR